MLKIVECIKNGQNLSNFKQTKCSLKTITFSNGGPDIFFVPMSSSSQKYYRSNSVSGFIDNSVIFYIRNIIIENWL